MFKGPESLKNKLLDIIQMDRVDLSTLGITTDSLTKLVNGLTWNELRLRPGSIRPANLDVNNLFVRDYAHSLLVLFFAIVQNICLIMRRQGNMDTYGLSGAIIYPLLFYFICLCKRVGSAALGKMLRGIDLCNFDITWLVCFTEPAIKAIDGMIRVPLHWNFNRNMFIFIGPMRRADDILKRKKKKKFAVGKFVKNSTTLLLELIEFCMLISPVVYGVRMLGGIGLLKIYVKLGETMSRNKKQCGLVPAAFLDFVALFELLKNVCERLGLGDMFTESMYHFLPANVDDLAMLINVLESLRGEKRSIIYLFIYAGDYREYYGNKLVLKYYHSDLDEIWVWRNW